VASAGLTAWGATWQADVFAAPSIISEEDVWAATLEAAARHRCGGLQVLVFGDATPLEVLYRSAVLWSLKTDLIYNQNPPRSTVHAQVKTTPSSRSRQQNATA
jgi:hypothetical protein